MASHFDVVVLGAGPGGYVAAIRAAQLGLKTAIIEKKYWGGVCLNVGCIPSKALLRNAELAHIFRKEAKTFGISGEVSFDFPTAVQRSRKVADGRVKGVHFLMKKNNITEFDGWGSFVDANTLDVALNDGGTRRPVTFDNCIIATGATTKLLPGTQLSERVVTYEEQILTEELPGQHHHRGRRRDRRRVRLRAGQLRREGDDRRVPRPDGPAGGRRGLEGAGEGVQEARRRRAHLDPGRLDRRLRRQGEGHRHRQGRQPADAGGRQGHAGDRLPAARRRLRPGQDRRQADRARRDRRRRRAAHQRAEHLRHRRRQREADARARGRGDGRDRGRDDRRRRDDGTRLRDDPARDLLPAAGRQLRLHRGAGPREGLRRQGRQVPLHRQRQGPRVWATRPASSR